MKVWFPAMRCCSGSDVFTLRLANALRQRGIEAEITWFDRRYEFAPSLLRHVPPPSGTTIVHAATWNGFAFKRPGIPLVVTEHQGWFGAGYRPYRSRAQQFYHEYLIKRYALASCKAASLVTTISQFSAAGLEKTLGVRDNRVIYNWIDPSIFSPSTTPNVHSDSPFKLLFVGNFTKLKGSDLLVQIMQNLGAGFQLSFTTGLKDLPAADIPGNMVSLGRLSSDDELVQAYRNCDALLFPSRFEGFGYVALEAMACGKPVIATNATGLMEVVRNGETGILCPPDDIGAFVHACKHLAEHPDICKQYGLAARQRAVEKFSENAILPQYIALYAGLVDNC